MSWEWKEMLGGINKPFCDEKKIAFYNFEINSATTKLLRMISGCVTNSVN